MGLIHVTPDSPILIEDKHTPIKETRTFKGVFRTLEDAAYATGVKVEDIVTHANTGEKVDGGTYMFSWPEFKEIQRLYPNYRIVRHQVATKLARPTTVNLRVAGKKIELHYRSMLSARECWQLSQRAFDLITTQTGGWRQHLPPAVTSIEVHGPEWRLPQGHLTPGGPGTPGPLFECRALANGKVRVRLVGDTFDGVRDTPQAILTNCVWKAAS